VPEDGSVVASPPREFTLTFNEPVAPLVLALVTAGGGTTALPNPTGLQATLVVPLPELPSGTYVLSWRVVSLDGHPVGGSIVFSIGAPRAGPLPDVEHVMTPAFAALLWVTKVAAYIGLFVGIGGAFFCTWIGPAGETPARSSIAVALLVGFIALPLSIGLQGADALGLALSAIGEKIAWAAGLETSYGITAIVAAFSLFAGFFVLAAGSARVARALSLFGILGVGFALALSGHASAAQPQWLTRPAVFAHAVCLAFWIGSLMPLAAVLRQDNIAATLTLTRFSRAIPFAIVPLLLSGLALALVQVETPGALVTTTYGRLLCAKLVLVAAILAIAAWNRRRLTPAVAADRARARPQLARWIHVELVLALVIFGLVATWRFTPPPRSLAMAANRPALVHIHTDKAMIDLTLSPGRVGPTQVSVMVLNGDFAGLDAKELTLTFRNEAAGIEPIVRSAVRDGSGYWIIRGLLIPVAGRWDVTVDILVNDFEKIVLEGTVDVRP
jgi:copper transport protein